MERTRGRRPVKFRALDDALRDLGFGGLLSYIAHRDQTDPQPTYQQIADDLFALGKVRVTVETVRLWVDRARNSGERREVTAA